MQLGRVIGTVVATRKYEGLQGCKLLLVQALDHREQPTGDPLVAVDTVQAGPGDLIYWVASREAALALDPWFVPVDAAIVGIVDEVAATAPESAINSDQAEFVLELPLDLAPRPQGGARRGAVS